MPIYAVCLFIVQSCVYNDWRDEYFFFALRDERAAFFMWRAKFYMYNPGTSIKRILNERYIYYESFWKTLRFGYLRCFFFFFLCCDNISYV